MWTEFKTFISRGSVIDMAVGIIIGAAFTAIVDSLVSDLVMPIIGLLTDGISFDNWKVPLNGDNALLIGNFINAVISFFLIAFVVFLMIKAINMLHKKKEEAPTTRVCPYCKSADVSVEATKCPHCASELTPANVSK